MSHSDPEPELDRVSSKIRLRNRGEPRESTRLGPDVTALAALQQRESLVRSPAQWVALGMVRCRGGSRSTIIVVARRARESVKEKKVGEQPEGQPRRGTDQIAVHIV